MKRGGHPARAAGVPRYAVATNGHAVTANASSDEDDFEAGLNPPVQRASARRQHRVDFTKLETASLKRYRKVYKLGEISTSNKEELIPAIARHFAQTVVDEEDTLVNFALTLKRHSVQQRQALQPSKKARNGVKPKGR